MAPHVAATEPGESCSRGAGLAHIPGPTRSPCPIVLCTRLCRWFTFQRCIATPATGPIFLEEEALSLAAGSSRCVVGDHDVIAVPDLGVANVLRFLS